MYTASTSLRFSSELRTIKHRNVRLRKREDEKERIAFLLLVNKRLGVGDQLRREVRQVDRLLNDRRIAVQEAATAQRLSRVTLYHTHTHTHTHTTVAMVKHTNVTEIQPQLEGQFRVAHCVVLNVILCASCERLNVK